MFSDFALLATTDRNGFEESFHFGIAALVAPDGSLLRAVGNVDFDILPRSTLKPLYAASMLARGLSATSEHLALACASIARHGWQVELAEQFARASRVAEHELSCPPSAVSGKHKETRFANVCIGKHIAMASVAKRFGSAAQYADPSHPLQQELRADFERLTGVRAAFTTVDGCGAPVYSTHVDGLARAYRLLRVPSGDDLSQHLIAAGQAMLAHPSTIEGDGRADTILLDKAGCLSKFGAEGTQVLVAPDGTTAAVYVADGSRRAGVAAALGLLEGASAIPRGTAKRLREPLGLTISGGGKRVGSVRSAIG